MREELMGGDFLLITYFYFLSFVIIYLGLDQAEKNNRNNYCKGLLSRGDLCFQSLRIDFTLQLRLI